VWVQASKFELVINAETARMLGLNLRGIEKHKEHVPCRTNASRPALRHRH
jgi:hypothetical protein